MFKSIMTSKLKTDSTPTQLALNRCSVGFRVNFEMQPVSPAPSQSLKLISSERVRAVLAGIQSRLNTAADSTPWT